MEYNDPARSGTVYTQQPIGGAANLGDPPGSTPVNGVTVRILRDTPEETAFAGRLLVDAFRDKMMHAVGEHNLPNLKKCYGGFYDNQEPWFYTRVFVAELEGKPVGVAHLRFHGEKERGEMSDFRELGCCALCGLTCLEVALGESIPRGKCYLECIAVEDGYRGKGIGKILMERSEYEARSRKCSHIYLGVVTTNPAKHLYERQGFTVTSEESCCGCLRCAAGIRSYYKMEKPLV